MPGESIFGIARNCSFVSEAQGVNGGKKGTCFGQMGYARGKVPKECYRMRPKVRRGVRLVNSEIGEVTELLIALKAGKHGAEEKLIPLVYNELRRLAAHYLRSERVDHTLQPTALVHEAYMRLIKVRKVDWQGRSHFFATAATVMRRILVDHARAQKANKREAMRNAVALEETLVVSRGRSQDLLALDAALDRLAKLNARQSKIVELRFFGGMNEQETGVVLGISSRTVKRDWRVAKAWLYHEINYERS
jgi:RNA polymerase sigma-70 factor, ECF subfamily